MNKISSMSTRCGWLARKQGPGASRGISSTNRVAEVRDVAREWTTLREIAMVFKIASVEEKLLCFGSRELE